MANFYNFESGKVNIIIKSYNHFVDKYPNVFLIFPLNKLLKAVYAKSYYFCFIHLKSLEVEIEKYSQISMILLLLETKKSLFGLLFWSYYLKHFVPSNNFIVKIKLNHGFYLALGNLFLR